MLYYLVAIHRSGMCHALRAWIACSTKRLHLTAISRSATRQVSIESDRYGCCSQAEPLAEGWVQRTRTRVRVSVRVQSSVVMTIGVAVGILVVLVQLGWCVYWNGWM